MSARPSYYGHRPQCEASTQRWTHLRCRRPAFYWERDYFGREKPKLMCGVHRKRRIAVGVSLPSYYSKLSDAWLLARAVRLADRPRKFKSAYGGGNI